ncbi:unnamed protein product [Notodromas monacha]|uniref:14-3-3 domain-containing protein n=1 Tax=Notodromas monacha TaxID=399045 RepID=A0A7R9BLM4_9CRUS|nr:unnamed protein product [Notodromas monacha]CAG0916676.1 unnamed protein product [Notodromas monacha]
MESMVDQQRKTHESLIFKAKLADQAERFNETVEYMKQAVLNGLELSVDERNLLSIGYKNVVGAKRSAWRVIVSLEQREAASGSADKVFYSKMKGDYYRYLAEISSEEERKVAGINAKNSYEEAKALAVKCLAPVHPIRLGLALNYSVYYCEILNDPGQACKIAKDAFDEALAELDDLGEESYKDTTLIMQLLRDNLTLWNTESNITHENEDLKVADASKDEDKVLQAGADEETSPKKDGKHTPKKTAKKVDQDNEQFRESNEHLIEELVESLENDRKSQLDSPPKEGRHTPEEHVYDHKESIDVESRLSNQNPVVNELVSPPANELNASHKKLKNPQSSSPNPTRKLSKKRPSGEGIPDMRTPSESMASFHSTPPRDITPNAIISPTVGGIHNPSHFVSGNKPETSKDEQLKPAETSASEHSAQGSFSEHNQDPAGSDQPNREKIRQPTPEASRAEDLEAASKTLADDVLQTIYNGAAQLVSVARKTTSQIIPSSDGATGAQIPNDVTVKMQRKGKTMGESFAENPALIRGASDQIGPETTHLIRSEKNAVLLNPKRAGEAAIKENLPAHQEVDKVSRGSKGSAQDKVEVVHFLRATRTKSQDSVNKSNVQPVHSMKNLKKKSSFHKRAGEDPKFNADKSTAANLNVKPDLKHVVTDKLHQASDLGHKAMDSAKHTAEVIQDKAEAVGHTVVSKVSAAKRISKDAIQHIGKRSAADTEEDVDLERKFSGAEYRKHPTKLNTKAAKLSHTNVIRLPSSSSKKELQQSKKSSTTKVTIIKKASKSKESLSERTLKNKVTKKESDTRDKSLKDKVIKKVTETALAANKKASTATAQIVEKAEAVAQDAKEQIAETADAASRAALNTTEQVAEKTGNLVAEAKGQISTTTAKISRRASDAKEAVAGKAEELSTGAQIIAIAAKEKALEAKEKVLDKIQGAQQESNSSNFIADQNPGILSESFKESLMNTNEEEIPGHAVNVIMGPDHVDDIKVATVAVPSKPPSPIVQTRLSALSSREIFTEPAVSDSIPSKISRRASDLGMEAAKIAGRVVGRLSDAKESIVGLVHKTLGTDRDSAPTVSSSPSSAPTKAIASNSHEHQQKENEGSKNNQHDSSRRASTKNELQPSDPSGHNVEVESDPSRISTSSSN